MMRRVAFAAVFAALIAGCNGSNTVATPKAAVTPTPTPTPTVAPQHLYVGNDNATGQILQFTLPLTATSTSNFGIASPNNTSVALDASGNLFAGDNAGHLTYFSAPLSAASVPAASFTNGSATNDGQITVTVDGNIFVANVASAVNGFTHPYSNATTPSQTITNAAMTSAIGAALDGSANLYVSNAGPGTSSTLLVFAPPYTGAPIVTPAVATTAYRKIAVSGTQLFATSVAGTTGRVDVYSLPITAASAPAFAITTGLNTPEAIALDAVGNLYVGNLSNATIAVYAPPFSAASAPSLTFTVGSGTFAIFGIFIGK
jgi:hypothetical protein